MKRSIEEIENDLDELQISYIDEDDDLKRMQLVRKFDQYLNEATETDNVLRIAVGVSITNWVRTKN